MSSALLECLFFLDIELKAQINGLQLAQEIRKLHPRCFIVVVTTHSEMSLLTFKYKAEVMDFIIKGGLTNIKEQLRSCMLDAKEKLVRQKFEKFLKISETESIEYGDILYFKTDESRRITLVAETTGIHNFAGKISDILEQLDERFYMCNRSHVVNLDNIKTFDSKTRVARMDGGITCTVAFMKRDEFARRVKERRALR